MSRTETLSGSLDTGVTMTMDSENLSQDPAAPEPSMTDAGPGPARLTVLAGPDRGRQGHGGGRYP